MKKFVSILLVLVLMMSLSVAAFASEVETDQGTTTTYNDQSTVTIHKVYKIANAGTTSPAETFTLVQVGKGTVSEGDATAAPDLGTITGASFIAGAATVNGTTGDIVVALPTYDHVGIYEYTLQEVAGKTAGVTYYGNNIKLVVTVINGDDGNLRIAAVHTESVGEKKSDNFPNTYSAGKLNISKTVTGNLGDKNTYFEFKVTLTGETGKTYGASYAVSGGTNSANPSTIKIGEETTFRLKHGETISIANLPYGVNYTVTETAVNGYTTTKTGDTGTINAADQTAAFTNDNNNSEIDTGVSMDSLPYILMLVVVGAAVVVIATRKKGEQF